MKKVNLLPTSGVSVSIKFGQITEQYNTKKNETVKQMRHSFSKMKNIELSSIRFLIDGQRLDDSTKVDTISSTEGYVIEAFVELLGGGRAVKKNISNDEKMIIEALDRSIENEDSFELDVDDMEEGVKNTGEKQEQNEKLSPKNKTNDNKENISKPAEICQIIVSDPELDVELTNSEELSDKETNNNVETKSPEKDDFEFDVGDKDGGVLNTGEKQDQNEKLSTKNTINDDKEINENLFKPPEICPTFVSDPKHYVEPNNSKELSDSETNSPVETETPAKEDFQWLDDLRKEDKFSKKKPLDNKIICLLKQPSLAEVEIQMLRNHLEMREKLEEWSKEVDDLIPLEKRKKRKKQPEDYTKVKKNLRKRRKTDNILPENKINVLGMSHINLPGQENEQINYSAM